MPRKVPAAFWIALCAIGAVPRLIDLTFHNSIENRDYGIIYAAGRLANADVYDPAKLTAFATQIFGFDQEFPYPPHALFLAAPFSVFPYVVAFALWTITGLAFFAWAARPYGFRILPLFLPATLYCVAYGQTGLFVGGLWLLAFRGSAFSIAALTIKPHIGFLAGVRALQDRQLLTKAVLWFVILVAASVAAFGVLAWSRFFSVSVRHATLDFMPSKFTGAILTYGVAGQLAFTSAAILLLFRRFDVFTAATATLLISPYSYPYDFTAASLGFALALNEERPVWQMLILVLGFLAPALTIFGGAVVPPILLGCLCVQVFKTPVAASPLPPTATPRSSMLPER